MKYAVNQKLAIGFGGQYFADAYGTTLVVDDFEPAVFDGGGSDWGIGAVADYAIVKGFDAKLAVNYFDGDTFVDGTWGGFARFTRSF